MFLRICTGSHLSQRWELWAGLWAALVVGIGEGAAPAVRGIRTRVALAERGIRSRVAPAELGILVQVVQAVGGTFQAAPGKEPRAGSRLQDRVQVVFDLHTVNNRRLEGVQKAVDHQLDDLKAAATRRSLGGSLTWTWRLTGSC